MRTLLSSIELGQAFHQSQFNRGAERYLPLSFSRLERNNSYLAISHPLPMLKTIPNSNLCYTVTRRVNYIKALSFHILGIHEILKYEELKRTIWI